MVGGDADARRHRRSRSSTRSRPRAGSSTPGAAGTGHFTKMVHNGIEYGLMQAYAEGYELLARSGLDIDATGALSRVAAGERGAVVAARPASSGPSSSAPGSRASAPVAQDSGEGRWTVQEAVERGVAVPVISAALFARFASQDEDSVAMKAIAALREQFGGHAVLPRTRPGRRAWRAARRSRRPRDRRPAPSGRARPLRGHRRPGQEEDLPGGLRDDASWATNTVPVVGFASSEWDDDRLRAARPRGHRGQGRRRRGGLAGPGRRASPTCAATTATPSPSRRSPTSCASSASSARSSTWPSRRSCSTTSSSGLASQRPERGRPGGGREAVRARPRLGPRAQRDPAPGLPRATTCSASTTSSARSRSRTCSCSASPTRCSSRCGTATSSPACRSPWPRTSAWRAGAGSTSRSAPCATSCRTTCSRSSPCSAMEPPGGRRRRRRCATSAPSCSARSARSTPSQRRAGPVPRLPRRGGRGGRLRRRDLRGPPPRDRLVALGRACRG